MSKMTLKALRVNKGLTQMDAAKMLGISPDTLARWETGKTYPDVADIVRIEKLYNVEYSNINFFCAQNTDKP